ncbi:energy transducer TonB [Ginsengibacter hankyongi]|nr:TonB family protein [Ginsengibacter hankyongi]
MNQDTILQSNLLDIIFENRNKDYGAYTLRKSYTSRMRIALLLMMALCLLLCLLFLQKPSSIAKVKSMILASPDRKLDNYQPPSQPAHKVVVNNIHPKKINTNELPPRIVDSININKLPATPLETIQSINPTSVSAINFPGGGEGFGKNLKIGAEAPAAPATKINKPGPVDVADIMPQYPGGVKALLDFLKKNLHAPEDVEEGGEVSVKIRFVVDYNGKLESFDVLKSGGFVFDNEVIRVLKKMPLWIPGRSNGENVSVYYVVPVKFTSEF